MRTIKCRCRVLLDLDMNHGAQYTYEQCANRHGMSKTTVRNVIDTFSSDGLDAVLTIKRSVNSDNANRKVDGRAESRIIQLACGPAPEGYGRWTLRLLADKSKVVLDEPVGKDAIARVLKKRNQTPQKPILVHPVERRPRKRFPPEEARRIYRKLEIHYTPKHGSWLDIAEIELNMMTRQCLDRRIDNIKTLRQELAAWECEKNNEEK